LTFKGKTILYGLLGLSVVGLGIAFIVYDWVKKDPMEALSAVAANQDLSLNHVHHVASRDGKKEWALDAESAQYQRQDHKTVFKEIAATFFLKSGKEVHLTGRDGILLTDSKNMEVSGGVVLKSGLYELNTEKLVYNEGAKTISAETPIKMTGKVISLRGDQLVFNLRTEKLIVSGGVKAVIAGSALEPGV